MRCSPVRWALTAVVLAASVGVSRADAQTPARRWEPRGFDFSRDGVWRRKAAAVGSIRRAALARGDLAALNASVSSSMVSGTLRVPIFLVAYKNTNIPALATASDYHDALLAAAPTLGRPYTIRSFYSEMSNGAFTVDGQVIGWVQLDSNDTWYEGPNNGLTSVGHIAQLIAEAVTKSDGTVDYTQFDNDGPDGLPNSGDDDGAVDVAVFVHPERDGACGPGSNRNVWSHRFFYAAWTGQTLATADARGAGGAGTVRVNNYTIQSGVGGSTACDSSQIMAPGTTAHETGHGLGLPDFYDTQPADEDDSEGAGHWSLMSSGNYATPPSPAYMEGFSRMTLGWVTVRDLTAPGAYALGPYTVSDTIFRIGPSGANPRGEYYLLENRQGTMSDSALIRTKGPGLLIWHVDQLQYDANASANLVNTGPIHGLKVEQADGRGHLESSVSTVRNRGDGGDPWPGDSARTSFAGASNPGAFLNTGEFSGIAIDDIQQLTPGGAVAFSLRFPAAVTVVDTVLAIAVRGSPYSDTLRVGGGNGTFVFALAQGALPAGLSLSAAGRFTGTPTVEGTSNITVVASSNGAGNRLVLRLEVREPALLAANVINAYLANGGSSLTSIQRGYLDQIGNQNNVFDVGDVMAWIDRTHSVVDAASMSRMLQRGIR